MTLLIALNHTAVILSADLSLHLENKKEIIFVRFIINIIFHLVTAGDWQRGPPAQGHLEFNLLTLFCGAICLASHRFVKTHV